MQCQACNGWKVTVHSIEDDRAKLSGCVNCDDDGKDIEPTNARHLLYKEIFDLYPHYLKMFPQTRMSEILIARYNVSDLRKMTISECADLLKLMRKSVEAV